MLRAVLALVAVCAGCAAAAPRSTPGAPRGTITLGLGQRGSIGGLAVTPLRVEEDSRCPAQVQCIQAGTVRLALRVGTRRRQAVLTLLQPHRLDAGAWLTLCAVTPGRDRPSPIRPAAYRFRFALHRQFASPPAVDSCR